MSEIVTEEVIDEIQQIPNGWKLFKIGELFKLSSGKARPDVIKSNVESDFIYPVFGGNGVIGFSNQYMVEKPTLVLGRVGEYCGNIHICPAYSWISDNALYAKEFLSKEGDIEYLSYYLHFLDLNKLKKKTGQPLINQSILYTQIVPLPPIDEQKRIAAKIQGLMQEVEEARSACQRQLEAVKALPSAYLQAVFKTAEADKWERKKLGEVCEHDSGVWGDEPDSLSLCYPVMRSNNIHNGQMVFSDIAMRKIDKKHIEVKKLKTGDILVTTSSGSIDLLGKNALFVQPPDDITYLFSNFTMRLRPNSEIVDSVFLYFYLQSPEAKETLRLLQDTTTGLRNMDRKEFIDQMVPIPSLSEQKRIAAKLQEKMSDAEKLRVACQNQLETINALPQAILRRAFSGKL